MDGTGDFFSEMILELKVIELMRNTRLHDNMLMTTKSSKCSSSHLSVKIKEVKVDQAVAESC